MTYVGRSRERITDLGRKIFDHQVWTMPAIIERTAVAIRGLGAIAGNAAQPSSEIFEESSTLQPLSGKSAIDL
jgi:hypothetical protein